MRRKDWRGTEAEVARQRRAGAHKMDDANQLDWLRSSALAHFERDTRHQFESGCTCRLCRHYGDWLAGRLNREMMDGYLAVYSTLERPHQIEGGYFPRR